jgi:phospholipase A-2-activating protein
VRGKVFGQSEGEIKVFKDQGKAKAYMWKSADRAWEELGEVVDPNQASSEAEPAGTVQMGGMTKQYPGDQLFEAGEYDHVFDVEIGDGIMRKLPFNNGANCLEAADKFCSREGTNAKMFKTRDFDGVEAKKAEQNSKYGPKASVIPFT